MAARFGKDGFISFDSSSGTTGGASGTTTKPTFIDTWSLTANDGLAEVTAFGDQWKGFLPTVRDYTIVASGNLDKSSTEQQALVVMGLLDQSTSYSAAGGFYVNVRLYESTAYWVAKGKVTEARVSAQQTGNIGVTYTIQVTSGVSYITT